MKSQSRLKIALVPFPAQGHLTPMVQLAAALNKLALQPIVFLPQFMHSQLISDTDDDDDGILFVPIPDGLDADQPRAHDMAAILHAMENTMPLHLDQLFQSFDGDEDGGIVYVIIDLLASWAIEVSNRRRIPVAGFWPAMFATYSIVKAIPILIQRGAISAIDGEPTVEEEALFLPSLPMINSSHLPWLVGNAAARLLRFKFWLRILERSSSLRWIFINSIPEEETQVNQPPNSTNSIPEKHNQGQQLPSSILNACSEETRDNSCKLNSVEELHYSTTSPRLCYVGPLTRHIKHNPSLWKDDDSCMKWLEQKKIGSVIYLSFGSWVSLSDQNHVVELAMALEESNLPFLWVLGSTPQTMLPSDFSERVGCRGKIVEWAPQREVLESDAVGFFLSHCGWNSTVEAIIAGKPLLCWPVSGDQFVNCEFVVKVWRIGVRLEGYKREDINRGILITKMVRWEELRRNIFGFEGEDDWNQWGSHCDEEHSFVRTSSCKWESMMNSVMAVEGGRINHNSWQ